MKHVIVDAVARATMYPVAFEVPTRRARTSLRVGDSVKLLFALPHEYVATERVWAQVVSVEPTDTNTLSTPASFASSRQG